VNASSQGFSTNAAFRVIGLGVPDVATVQAVYAVVKSTDTSTWVNVTSRYDLDNGQRSWAAGGDRIGRRLGRRGVLRLLGIGFSVYRWPHETSLSVAGDGSIGKQRDSMDVRLRGDSTTVLARKPQGKVTLRVHATMRLWKEDIAQNKSPAGMERSWNRPMLGVMTLSM